MTRDEALSIISEIARAYPKQPRDADFIKLMASRLVLCGLPAVTVARRAVDWIDTRPWWPAISDLIYPETSVQSTKLLPSPKALPASLGIAKFRQTLKGPENHEPTTK